MAIKLAFGNSAVNKGFPFEEGMPKRAISEFAGEVAKAETEPTPEKPADPQAETEKPLSRLEQLRQRAK